MSYSKEQLQQKFFSRDLTGLSLAALVRLSFEPDRDKPEKQERPYLSGADINGREDQEDRARRSIETRGGRWVFTYDEPDTSAWKRKKVRVVAEDGRVDYIYRVIRPVYEGALKDLKRGIAPNGEPLDGLIVYDLDRLTRDNRHLEDAIDVVEHHGKLITDINLALDLFSDMGRSNASFLVTAKAMQSTDTARRVRDKHEAIAMAGIPVGGSRPFGWNEDKRTRHPLEAELLRRAGKDTLLGIGLHAICREWSDAGVKTPKGNAWTHQTLRNVLLNPRLAGYRIYRGEICRGYDGKPVMGQYEAIFEIPEWEAIRDYLTQDSRTAQGGHHEGGLKYLLSGIVRCGLCGARCRGRWDNRQGVHHYACPSPTDSSGGCGKVSINGPQLDTMITQQVLDYLSTMEIQTEAQPWPREAELAAAEAKILDLMEAYQADILLKEDVFPAVAQLRGTARTLRRERSTWNREQMRAAEATTTVVDKWPELSTDRQRTIIASVVHTVAIRKPTIKAARFDPNRVEVVRHKDLAALPQRLAGLAGMSGSVLPHPR